MNRKLLGLFGLIGAPALALGTHLMGIHHPLAETWFGKSWGLLYITGWLASMEGLRRMEATGTDWFGKLIVRIVMVTLCLANVFNVWEIIDPTSTSPLYFIVDMCWPLSNVLMIPVGIAVLRAGRLRSWQRWVPLFVGFWLPLTLLLSKQFGMDSPVMHIAGVYSVLTWSLLAITVMTAAEPKSELLAA